MIEVKGLAELQAELKKVDAKLPRELTKAHKRVAMTVMAEAQSTMSALNVPKADEAATGMKPAGGQKWAGIKLAAENPYVRAVEFGTSWHRVFGRWVEASKMKRRVYQPWGGNGEDAGYALYPTLRQFLRTPRFEETYHGALDDVYAKAFPERI